MAPCASPAARQPISAMLFQLLPPAQLATKTRMHCRGRWESSRRDSSFLLVASRSSAGGGADRGRTSGQNLDTHPAEPICVGGEFDLDHLAVADGECKRHAGF